MDELLKLFSGLSAQGDGGNNLNNFLPILMKLMANSDTKKDVELSTSELSLRLHELIKKDL